MKTLITIIISSLITVSIVYASDFSSKVVKTGMTATVPYTYEATTTQDTLKIKTNYQIVVLESSGDVEVINGKYIINK